MNELAERKDAHLRAASAAEAERNMHQALAHCADALDFLQAGWDDATVARALTHAIDDLREAQWQARHALADRGGHTDD